MLPCACVSFGRLFTAFLRRANCEPASFVLAFVSVCVSVCGYALCILRAKIMDLDHEQALARAPLRLARVRGALKRFDLVRFSLDYAPVRTTTQPDLPLCRRALAAAETVAASVIDKSSEIFQLFLD